MANQGPDSAAGPPGSLHDPAGQTGFDPHTGRQRVLGWMRQAGRMALALQSDGEVLYKADGTPQTPADRQVQDFLIQKIRRQYPEHAILTEEAALLPGNRQVCWVIDPIDGTRAYAAGLPVWCISLALVSGEDVVFGACYQPATGEMTWGDAERAACNEQPIRPASMTLDDPLAALLVPSNAHQKYRIHYPRLRSLGSTAAHLAYLARGAALGVITRPIYAWDVAGVYPALRAAGIRLETISGSSFSLKALLDGETTAGPLLAAPDDLFEQILSLIDPIG